jgi:hypothetical protein
MEKFAKSRVILSSCNLRKLAACIFVGVYHA